MNGLFRGANANRGGGGGSRFGDSDGWEIISLFSMGRAYCKMGEGCPAMYVTVSFIMSVMMKLVCL